MNTGPGRNSKALRLRFHTVTPTTSVGSRSGVNWMRPNDAVDRRGERLGQAGLADAGHVLDEEVPLGDEAEQHELDHLGLALDHLLDVGDDVGVVVGEGRAAGSGLLPGEPPRIRVGVTLADGPDGRP